MKQRTIILLLVGGFTLWYLNRQAGWIPQLGVSSDFMSGTRARGTCPSCG